MPPLPPARIPAPPAGWKRLAWLGPGFLWMVSAAGSGELLFTPRVGALYGYALLWALLAAVALKWVVNREIGRYAVCRGVGVLQAFLPAPGRRPWVFALIVLPQVVVAVATLAGLAGGAATAVALAAGGDVRLWAAASLLSSTALVTLGRYKGVEKVATGIAVGLAAAAVAAAVAVRPDAGALAAGVVPSAPPDVDLAEVLPWLGFMLSGAAGLMWYSYWVRARGYGAAADKPERPVDPHALATEDRRRLSGWIRQVTLDTTVAVVGTLVITLAFLVLGAELLRPRGLVPEEERIAEVLGHLLGDVFGPVGFWFMVLGVFVGFWDTILSDQDGFGRFFADAAAHTLRDRPRGRVLALARAPRAWVLTLLTAAPLALYLAIGEPVTLLKIAGTIEAVQIPIVGAYVLRRNLRLPADLAPRRRTIAAMLAAVLFFGGFALLYLAQEAGIGA
ncbi:MAG TPA: Nramp family divalent metal transporter [Candidatus Thermoplasmatota archaeon]|nr:Nramp family divalent metal transporter [Candidatus Thermoplasmatota archaeon]